MASGAASGEGEASQPTLGIGQAWLRAVKRDALLQFLLGVHAFGVQHEQAVVSLLGHPGQHTPPGQATTESSQAASPVRRGISAFVLRLFSQQEGSKAPYSPTREDVQAVMQFLAANCVDETLKVLFLESGVNFDSVGGDVRLLLVDLSNLVLDFQARAAMPQAEQADEPFPLIDFPSTQPQGEQASEDSIQALPPAMRRLLAAALAAERPLALGAESDALSALVTTALSAVRQQTAALRRQQAEGRATHTPIVTVSQLRLLRYMAAQHDDRVGEAVQPGNSLPPTLDTWPFLLPSLAQAAHLRPAFRPRPLVLLLWSLQQAWFDSTMRKALGSALPSAPVCAAPHLMPGATAPSLNALRPTDAPGEGAWVCSGGEEDAPLLLGEERPPPATALAAAAREVHGHFPQRPIRPRWESESPGGFPESLRRGLAGLGPEEVDALLASAYASTLMLRATFNLSDFMRQVWYPHVILAHAQHLFPPWTTPSSLARAAELHAAEGTAPTPTASAAAAAPPSSPQSPPGWAAATQVAQANLAAAGSAATQHFYKPFMLSWAHDGLPGANTSASSWMMDTLAEEGDWLPAVNPLFFYFPQALPTGKAAAGILQDTEYVSDGGPASGKDVEVTAMRLWERGASQELKEAGRQLDLLVDQGSENAKQFKAAAGALRAAAKARRDVEKKLRRNLETEGPKVEEAFTRLKAAQQQRTELWDTLEKQNVAYAFLDKVRALASRENRCVGCRCLVQGEGGFCCCLGPIARRRACYLCLLIAVLIVNVVLLINAARS